MEEKYVIPISSGLAIDLVTSLSQFRKPLDGKLGSALGRFLYVCLPCTNTPVLILFARGRQKATLKHPNLAHF